MSEWRKMEINQVAQLKKNSWKVGDEELPYVALEHIVEGGLRLQGIGDSNTIASNKLRFDSDCFLFGKLRPYFRKLYKPDFDGICSTDIWVIKPKGNNNKDFLFYFFANQEFVDLTYSGSSGTRMPRADWSFIGQSRWDFPEPIEQKAIAEVLSSLDDKIDLLHRQNKTLEQMAQTLFRQWFVEEAKEDWEEGILGEIIKITSGKGLKKDKFVDNGKYPVLGANGEIGRTNEFLFDHRLIFTGRVGTLGNVFRIESGKVWLSDNTLVITPLKYYNFIYFILKNTNLGQYNVGSTQPLIRQSDIKEIAVVLSDDNIHIEFEKKSNILFDKINKNQTQIRTLESLRDTLLPKLMSGEVRIASHG